MVHFQLHLPWKKHGPNYWTRPASQQDLIHHKTHISKHLKTQSKYLTWNGWRRDALMILYGYKKQGIETGRTLQLWQQTDHPKLWGVSCTEPDYSWNIIHLFLQCLYRTAQIFCNQSPPFIVGGSLLVCSAGEQHAADLQYPCACWAEGQVGDFHHINRLPLEGKNRQLLIPSVAGTTPISIHTWK